MITAERLREVLSYDSATGIFRWKIKPRPQSEVGDIAGTRHNQGYWHIRVLGQHYLAHRLAWLYMTGEWPEALVDHRDRNRSNNAWLNLRAATKSQNAANSAAHADSISGIKGVRWHEGHRKWDVTVCVNGVRTCHGRFDDLDEAKAAYAAAAELAFGDFARAA
jgi:hypothetical protein